MKATELKIGDIVSFLGNLTKVHSIDPPAIYVIDEGNIVWGTNEINNDITPVPLTKGILKKNGWEFAYGKWRTENFALQLTKKQFLLYLRNKPFITRLRYIKYVHELQHLLWALGMDDNLKI